MWYDLSKNAEAGNASIDQKNHLDQSELPFIHGLGAGGSITAIKFNPFKANMVFTTSIDGTFKQQDFEGKESIVYLDTLNKEKWFTALDVSSEHRIIAVGSNSGSVILKDFNGKGTVLVFSENSRYFPAKDPFL